jgi:hypothetical protein
MTSDPSSTPLARLFRACEPNEALSSDDPRYVNCDDVRGENLPRLYERSLRLADPSRSEVKVFAGHRGVGKSSELLRLKKMLEEPTRGRPFRVLFVDVSRTLDLNDLDFPDLLVFLAAEIQRQLRDEKIPGFTTSTVLVRRVWDELKERVQGLDVTDLDVEVPFVSLAVELKNRPSARARLREAIEAQSTGLLEAVNDLLLTARVGLRQAGYEGLVLIVDGLDKLVRRDLEDGRGNTHERLFIHRSEQLASLKAHVIYTVPISLIYSPQFTQLEQTFGEHQIPVSMIRLRGGNNADPSPDTPGMRKMREMLEARCRHAAIECEKVFDSPQTRDFLCEMTGGHPRHLMMFIQAAASRVDDLPITREAVEKAIRGYANSLLREIPDEFWPELRKFGTPQESIPKDAEHQMMLLLLHIFEYMNGRPWYEVNPVIRSLPRFRED